MKQLDGFFPLLLTSENCHIARERRIYMDDTKKKTLEFLSPVEIAKGKIQYAQAIKAGNWIFATGHMATDFKQGLSPEVHNPRLPRSGKPKNEKETDFIFNRLKSLLSSAGSGMSNVVRVDQYYTTWKAVDPYHVGRKAAFGDYIPPSTSILQKGLLINNADIEVEMIAVVPSEDFSVEAINPPEIDAPASSGYAPAVRAGDFIFVAGMMATSGKGRNECIPPEARPVPGYLWRGKQIKLETEYIIKHRLEPALRASGSSLGNIVKAQVYMRDIEDFPAFREVWNKYFPENPPVTTLIPTATPGFAISEAAIEITVLALADGGKTKKEIIKHDVFTGYEDQTVAIRAGDLLFITGLMAADENGLAPGCEIDPRQPYFGSSAQCQMEHILNNAEKICQAAGTSLKNVVRIQQFHTDLNEFYPAYQSWQNCLPGQALPFSAVEVPAPLPIPGCTILTDLWVYAP